ncbi:hypothetical protein BJV78DRAFT_685995 [Lactifluus subvellereus]|nr:hypothetical protein BJV78DRAFT_685995 [Lactifluus subvellereus]
MVPWQQVQRSVFIRYLEKCPLTILSSLVIPCSFLFDFFLFHFLSPFVWRSRRARHITAAQRHTSAPLPSGVGTRACRRGLTFLVQRGDVAPRLALRMHMTTLLSSPDSRTFSIIRSGLALPIPILLRRTDFPSRPTAVVLLPLHVKKKI